MLENFNEDKKRVILDVLQNYLTVQKSCEKGEFMLTSFCAKEETQSSYVIAKLQDAQNLTAEEEKILVHIIDFMVVFLPDLEQNQWDADLLDIASKLRRNYFKKYSEKVYE